MNSISDTVADSVTEYKLPSVDELFKFDEINQYNHKDFIYDECMKYCRHIIEQLYDTPPPDDSNAQAEEDYQKMRWTGYEVQEAVEHAYVRAFIASNGKPPCIYEFSDEIYHETYDIEPGWEAARETAIENQTPTIWPEYLEYDREQQVEALWELYSYLNVAFESVIHEFDTVRRLYLLSKKN